MDIFNKSSRIVQFLIISCIIVVVNILAQYFYAEFDLTDDNRFTITDNTEKLVANLDDNVTVKILLEGEFPAGFRRLQVSTRELIQKFRDINPNIIFEFEDPNEGNAEQKEARRKMLTEEKIVPISLSFRDGTQVVQKAIFPFAIIYYKNKKSIINLLEEQKMGDDEDQILNKSVALLEYKFANAFQRLSADRMKNILFTQGSDEWDQPAMFRLESELRSFHKVGRVSLDSLVKLDSTIDVVIIAGPKTAIKPQNLFKLDQYIMAGGKIVWLLDKFHVSLDSISKQQMYVPQETDTGTDDLLFKYGVRIVPNLIMDMECSQIPQVVGMSGDKPQTKLFRWFYHPTTFAGADHPIVKNIDRVNMFFPSSIDTIKTATNIKKTALLTTSPYTKTQLSPMRLTFEILKVSPDPSKFREGKKNVAVLLEGEFESMYKNRITPDIQNSLDRLNIKFVDKSKPTKQLIVTDSDFAKNLVNLQTGVTEDIGYNKWERNHYKGNKEFILNAIEYLIDADNVLQARSKEVKLRMLDPVKSMEEKSFWQWFNVGLPVVLLIIFGLIYQYLRKRKYAQ